MNEDLKLKLPDGRTLAYAEYGDPDGAVVLCLHGTSGTRHLFSLVDASARDHGLRLIAPDRAGIGDSDDRPNHSIGGHVDDFVALADHLEAEKFAVLGFSGGGPYAVEVARKVAHRVRAVALVSAYVLGLSAGPGHQALMKLADANILIARWLFVALTCAAAGMPRLVGAVLSLGINSSDRQTMKDPEILRCLAKGMAGVLWSGRSTAYEARNFYRERAPSLIELDAPVRIWHGMEDKIVAPKAALRHARMFPGASLNVIPGAGHLWGLAVGHDEVLEALATDVQ